MNKKRIFFGVLLYSLQAAITTVALNNGYGRGDLSAFLIWTILFSLLMIPVGTSIRRISENWRFPIRLGTLFLIPFFFGLCWGFVVLHLLGFWFRLFSFPVTLCWMAAASVCLSSSEVTDHFHPKLLGRGIILLGSLLVCGSIPPLISNGYVYLSGEQTLEVSLFRWLPGPKPFSGFDKGSLMNLTESDIRSIRKSGIKGVVFDGGGGAGGNGPVARLIFFVATMPDREITLPLPDRCFMIYYEVAPNQFERWPKDAKVKKEQIHILPASLDKGVEPELRRPDEVSFWTESSRYTLTFDLPKAKRTK